MAFTPGTAFGHYKILAQLGTGGMGEVFLAQDTRLERKVAIKFLKNEFSHDSDKLNRFIREAKAASALNHPNILTVFEIGETDETMFIATEFIEGKTLREQFSEKESLQMSSVLNIGIQVAEALAAAHHAGIVHRDIKPENIMVRADGYAKVLDFGLAKLIEKKTPGDVSSEIVTKALIKTNPGVVMGTASYMSPEQARGRETDARTDLWSLGVVLYEMLAQRVPFTGETINHTIVAILEKEPPRLENIPEELQRIVRKSLTKDKEMRYQTAQDFLIDLKNLRRTLDIQGELERSSSPNREIPTASLHDSETQFYLDQSVEKTSGNTDTKAHSTVRVDAGGISFSWKAAVALVTAGLIVWAGWWYFSKSGREEINSGLLKSTGIANWSSGPNELAVEAAFSPDAKMIAFGSARSGATEIWVKPVIGGEAIQVTKNGFYNQYPVWSPNGQELAFFSNRGDKRGIWRTSFTGGEQTKIAEVNGMAQIRYWSKSGKIYYQNGANLFAVDDKSGETKRLTEFENNGLKPRFIGISDDESKIAFSIKEGDLYKIKVKQIGAEKFDEITVSKDQIDNLTWHPNGNELIFSATVDGTYQLFKSAISGDNPIQLSTGELDFLVQDISNDGDRILYWSQNENSDLWLVNLADGHETLLADSTASEYWATLAPEVKSVAYQSVAKANRPFSGAIAVKSIPETGTALTISPNGFAPVWSKNGKWLTFFKRSEREIEIWGVEATGSDARKLASGGIQSVAYTAMPFLKIGINQLISSPNSDAVAYAAKRDGKSNIWLVSANGEQDEQLTSNEDTSELLCCPSWSSDGKYLVVSSNLIPTEPGSRILNRLWLYTNENSAKKIIFETTDKIRFLGIGNGEKAAVVAVIRDSTNSTPTPDSIDINLISLETGLNSRVNTLNNAYFHNIHLSPDGKTIAFVTRRENVSAVWVVPVDGGAPRKIMDDNNPKVFISTLSWSPDGKSIVFGRQSQNSLLSMLTK